MSNYKFHTDLANAPRLADWIRNRGGVLRWPSEDLSDFDRGWFTPFNDENHITTNRPHWKCGSGQRKVLVTDPAEIEVAIPKEVKRFRVAVRMSSQGLSLKVTDGGTRRIRAAVAKAADNAADHLAWYEFDYQTQEAIIYVHGTSQSLADWMAANLPAPEADPAMSPEEEISMDTNGKA